VRDLVSLVPFCSPILLPLLPFLSSFLKSRMKEKGHDVPPRYIPLRESGEADAEGVATTPSLEVAVSGDTTRDSPKQWSSGICACFDDIQSCTLLFVLHTLILLHEPSLVYKLVLDTSMFMGLRRTWELTAVCLRMHRFYWFVLSICYVFGKNAELLGSGTFAGPCLTHCISWALVNTICCFATNGLLLGLPGCFVSCYACGYRRSLRNKYNLQEAPCGDFVTHFFCHLCAICQEYREIRERSSGSTPPDMKMAITNAPLAQTMESAN
ncbi:hypothetical protein DY000_02035757, partial [Brassica cretica]